MDVVIEQNGIVGVANHVVWRNRGGELVLQAEDGVSTPHGGMAPMSILHVCNSCGYLSGLSGDGFYRCPCSGPEIAAERRYRRLLNSWTRDHGCRNYEPDDFDPPDAA